MVRLILVSAGVLFLCSAGAFFLMVPLLSIACCVLLMAGLPLVTWLRFFVWLIIGLVIYLMFGRRHSVLEAA